MVHNKREAVGTLILASVWYSWLHHHLIKTKYISISLPASGERSDSSACRTWRVLRPIIPFNPLAFVLLLLPSPAPSPLLLCSVLPFFVSWMILFFLFSFHAKHNCVCVAACTRRRPVTCFPFSLFLSRLLTLSFLFHSINTHALTAKYAGDSLLLFFSPSLSSSLYCCW